MHMEDDRICTVPKQAIRWQMDSCTRRRPGRPRLNWIDTATRDLKSVDVAWEEAEQAAVDREDWRGRVAQCVFDTGWTQVILTYLLWYVCLIAACNCDFSGAYGVSCDQQTGQCDCRPTFDGLTCNKCKPNFYNYPICEGMLSPD